ncbi:hypothetical protein [Clostridium sp. UBA4548]|uniref:hypothetical protein n=2 Tax=Clostridium TaxID=1485 RepID=UPI0025C0ECEA|nr:hypothetical protein [Clostridium sp. UBA4548]
MYKTISVICILLLFIVAMLTNFSLLSNSFSTVLIVLLMIAYFIGIVFIKFDLFNKVISKYKRRKKSTNEEECQVHSLSM